MQQKSNQQGERKPNGNRNRAADQPTNQWQLMVMIRQNTKKDKTVYEVSEDLLERTLEMIVQYSSIETAELTPLPNHISNS